jgi:phosphopantothenoylcysteine decarboxylase/phosphopantothenate--cysteine ligase
MRKTLPSFLVTTGPTREYIDPTRFISNPSSGKMGYLIAKTAKKAGCKVLLISGPTQITTASVNTICVTSARDMLAVVKRHFREYDVIVMTAAVCDYRPKKQYPKKIKKDDHEKILRLVPNPDILSWISKHKRNQFIVGFAAETNHVLVNARKKLVRKKLDMIVANRVGRRNAGFESDKIECSIIEPGHLLKPIYIEKKEKLARELVLGILKKFVSGADV